MNFRTLQGLDVKQQHPLKVYVEDGTFIGDYNVDMFVDNRMIIELRIGTGTVTQPMTRPRSSSSRVHSAE